MNLKLIGFFTAVTIAAFFAGKYLFPNTRTVVKTSEVVKFKTKKVILETKRKLSDGSEISETKTVENGESLLDRSSAEKSGAAGLTLGILATANASDWSKRLEYGCTITAPLVSRLKIQALVTTEKRVGLGLALEF